MLTTMRLLITLIMSLMSIARNLTLIAHYEAQNNKKKRAVALALTHHARTNRIIRTHRTRYPFHQEL